VAILYWHLEFSAWNNLKEFCCFEILRCLTKYDSKTLGMVRHRRISKQQNSFRLFHAENSKCQYRIATNILYHWARWTVFDFRHSYWRSYVPFVFKRLVLSGFGYAHRPWHLPLIESITNVAKHMDIKLTRDENMSYQSTPCSPSMTPKHWARWTVFDFRHSYWRSYVPFVFKRLHMDIKLTRDENMSYQSTPCPSFWTVSVTKTRKN
jgi:hypothetical protein